MNKNIGHIHMPEEIFNIIEVKSKNDLPESDDRHLEPEKPDDYNREKYNERCYLIQFNRLIDPVIIALFFGLYHSKELPPVDTQPIILDKSYEFSASIATQVDIFNHLLFSLWIKTNGFPDEDSDTIKYRRELYHFIEKIIDQQYFVNVIVPFYLDQATKYKAGTSFLFRLRESGFVEWKSTDISPEYLAMEFNSVQSSFIEEVIKPLLPSPTE